MVQFHYLVRMYHVDAVFVALDVGGSPCSSRVFGRCFWALFS